MADAMTEFLPRIIQQEHLLLACKATIACFQVMRNQFNGSYDLQVNMDFTLTQKNGQICPALLLMPIAGISSPSLIFLTHCILTPVA
ncbi:MAG: hypothetical protein ACK55I_30415, partial [bacterium]|jgi:hypothetical protein